MTKGGFLPLHLTSQLWMVFLPKFWVFRKWQGEVEIDQIPLRRSGECIYVLIPEHESYNDKGYARVCLAQVA